MRTNDDVGAMRSTGDRRQNRTRATRVAGDSDGLASFVGHGEYEEQEEEAARAQTDPGAGLYGVGLKKAHQIRRRLARSKRSKRLRSVHSLAPLRRRGRARLTVDQRRAAMALLAAKTNRSALGRWSGDKGVSGLCCQRW